jgi:cell division protein FtsL
MGVFEMVVVVVAISVGGGIYMQHMKLQRRRLSSGSSSDIARIEKIAADAQAEVAALKERVKVLEALATDGDRHLANEIERLRPRV